jgi:hypothetical protein
MMRLTLCLLPALLLAGCDQPAPEQPAAKISVRSPAQKAMFELNDLNRAIALKRAIYDYGAACLRVTKSGFVGTYKNMDYWTATCEDSQGRTRDWALFIGANDDVQLRLCKDVASVGLPPCVIQDREKAPERDAPAPSNVAG